jgi:hypothetical protein
VPCCSSEYPLSRRTQPSEFSPCPSHSCSISRYSGQCGLNGSHQDIDSRSYDCSTPGARKCRNRNFKQSEAKGNLHQRTEWWYSRATVLRLECVVMSSEDVLDLGRRTVVASTRWTRPWPGRAWIKAKQRWSGNSKSRFPSRITAPIAEDSTTGYAGGMRHENRTCGMVSPQRTRICFSSMMILV